MVVLISIFYLFFHIASCDKKNDLEAESGKKTETAKDDGQEEEEDNNESEPEQEDPDQEETPDQQEEEDPNFNYDAFRVDKGFHVPFSLGETPAPYGYYLFFPESYKKLKNTYPLLVFLHGWDERGDSKTNKSELGKVLKHGPGKLINKKSWSPKEEMLVVSAQTPNQWNSEDVKKLIDYLVKTYRVDKKRVYLTGLSMGGHGTFDYLGKYGAESGIAAAVPICGWGDPANSTYVKNVSKVPIWMFHGEADRQIAVSRALAMAEALYNVESKIRPKLTLYPNVGHDSWTITYDGSGRDKENPDYDVFDQDIYSWMLQYRLP